MIENIEENELSSEEYHEEKPKDELESEEDFATLFEDIATFEDEMSEVQEISHLNLVLFILDGSTSMLNNGISRKRKAVEVKHASNSFLGRLAGSSARNSFYIGGVAFSEESMLLLGHEYVALGSLLSSTDVWGKYSNELSDFELAHLVDVIDSPTEIVGGGMTNVTAALEQAELIADSFMNDVDSSEVFENIGTQNRSVVLFLLSDGQHNMGEEPYELASAINDKYPICCISYGGDRANKEMLMKIAQSSSYFLETDSPEILREFFTSSTAILTAR